MKHQNSMSSSEMIIYLTCEEHCTDTRCSFWFEMFWLKETPISDMEIIRKWLKATQGQQKGLRGDSPVNRDNIST